MAKKTKLQGFVLWLRGKKTHFVILAFALVWVLSQLGYLPVEVAEKLYELLGLTGAVTLTAKLNRIAK